MKQLFLVFALVLPILLTAQHQLGWRTDNYAGINAAFINPAAPARTPYSWDLNIGEGNLFFANNYIFFENESVPSLLKSADNEKATYFFRANLPSDFSPGEDDLIYDYNTSSSYYAQQHFSVLGPSLSFRVAPMTRIGIFSRWQFMSGSKNLDPDLGFYAWDAIPDNTGFTLDAGRMASAAWSELGLNLTQGFILDNGDVHIGVSARKLYGKRAAYFINKDDFTLSKLTDHIGLEGQAFDIEAGFTNNALEEDNLNNSAGSGWGLDVGFLYQIDLGDDFYRWEIGGALLDIGQLNFTDAQSHQFNSEVLANTLNDSYENLSGSQSLESINQVLSQDIFGDSTASFVSNEFNIHLPTTLSFQLTYRFNEWIKVEANYLTSVAPKKGASLSRPTTVGITPRMDRHWWSIGMPVSYYAGEQLRLGLSARLGPVVIGTDQIGSFFKQKELDSSDIYFAVKFFPLGLFSKGNSRGKSGKKRGKGGKDVDCYKF